MCGGRRIGGELEVSMSGDTLEGLGDLRGDVQDTEARTMPGTEGIAARGFKTVRTMDYIDLYYLLQANAQENPRTPCTARGRRLEEQRWKRAIRYQWCTPVAGRVRAKTTQLEDVTGRQRCRRRTPQQRGTPDGVAWLRNKDGR